MLNSPKNWERERWTLFSFDHYYISTKHAFLFLLKSLSLDLERRLPLGTNYDGKGVVKRKSFADNLKKKDWGYGLKAVLLGIDFSAGSIAGFPVFAIEKGLQN